MVYKEKEKGRSVAATSQVQGNVFEIEVSPLPYKQSRQCRLWYSHTSDELPFDFGAGVPVEVTTQGPKVGYPKRELCRRGTKDKNPHWPILGVETASCLRLGALPPFPDGFLGGRRPFRPPQFVRLPSAQPRPSSLLRVPDKGSAKPSKAAACFAECFGEAHFACYVPFTAAEGSTVPKRVLGYP